MNCRLGDPVPQITNGVLFSAKNNINKKAFQLKANRPLANTTWPPPHGDPPTN